MDNKKKAAELVMAFLPIVGQDPYTGITTAKECAKKAAEIVNKSADNCDWDEVIKLIDTF
jgi:hypothetical protein